MIQLQAHAPSVELAPHEATAMHEPSWLEIDLNRLERNTAAVRSFLAQRAGDRAAPALCASLKKDGYGLGAGPMSHRLVKAGCDMLAVYSPAEAERLVERGLSVPILVLMPMDRIARTDTLYRPAVAERLHLTAHDPQQLERLNETGQTLGIRLPRPPLLRHRHGPRRAHRRPVPQRRPTVAPLPATSASPASAPTSPPPAPTPTSSSSSSNASTASSTRSPTTCPTTAAATSPTPSAPSATTPPTST